ncbi:MAG: F0F1 ATP synthase subunit delta, partial [Ruminococcus sp.]|nr:F0F1 ATP synthase subunit delta [Ruminococcus sp.]
MKDNQKDFIKELIRLDVPQEDIDSTRNILSTCPDVADTLSNPLVTPDEKRNIIKKLFPEILNRFLINVVRDGAIDSLTEIFDEYSDILLEKQNSIRAVVR